MDFDYKKYSFEQLENWLHDAISSGEASPHEIYSLIRKVVKENYDIYNERAKNCFGLLELLSGHRPVDLDNGMRPWGHSDLEYLANDLLTKDRVSNFPGEQKLEDKVVKWQLPVELDGASGEYYVMFPDDLLEAANLKEGDQVEWVDQGDGSYLLKRVEN